jgi:NADH:ubiquinone oxidoreductase subunit 5 (subunit L)/multisubunit Na+/H+ antiporter MnhA subunit
VNHGLFKALLFLGIGAVISAAGTRGVRAASAASRGAMPWTFAPVRVG